MQTIETKVIAAGAGGLAAGEFSRFVVWLLGVVLWHQPDTALKAGEAIAAVPGPVAALVPPALGGVCAFLAGYVAPHTSRRSEVGAPTTGTPPDGPGRHAVAAGLPAGPAADAPPATDDPNTAAWGFSSPGAAVDPPTDPSPPGTALPAPSGFPTD